MLAELVGGPVAPAFRTSYIRGKSKNWTREHWRMTYGFPDSTKRTRGRREGRLELGEGAVLPALGEGRVQGGALQDAPGEAASSISGAHFQPG